MSFGRIAGMVYGGLFGLVLFCAACDTQAPVSTNTVGGSSRLTKSYSHIQNPNNPYNFCGELHNEAMDSMAAWTPVGVVYDAEQADSLICHFLVQKGWGFIRSNGDTVRYTTEAADTLQSWVLENGTTDVFTGELAIDWAYDGANLTTQQQGYIDSIRLAVAAVDYPVTSTIYVDAMIDLNRIENDILASSSMTTEQKVLPLSIVALGKHSLEYWAHDTPPRLHSLAMGLGKRTATAGIRKVVEKDVYGAAVGGTAGIFGGLIGGAVVGSILPGAGTAVGAAAGAIGGLISGVIGGGHRIAQRHSKWFRRRQKKEMSSNSNRLHQVAWLVMIPIQALVVVATSFVLSNSGEEFDERMTTLFITTPWMWLVIPLIVLLGYFQSWFVLRRLSRHPHTS